jgi:cyclopropane fatty-acyl-phospholipid synthase-like methyltransferase
MIYRSVIVAVDLQQKMLDVMRRRAGRCGVADRITAHRCGSDSLGLKEPADFILAFWMVHEVGDKDLFFQQLRSILPSKGKILIAEPKMHVTAEELDKTIEIAQNNGLRHCDAPVIRFSWTALLQKS